MTADRLFSSQFPFSSQNAITVAERLGPSRSTAVEIGSSANVASLLGEGMVVSLLGEGTWRPTGPAACGGIIDSEPHALHRYACMRIVPML